MLSRIASILFLLVVSCAGRAQAPANAPANSETAALASRAVMTGDQVIHILDETVDWYRMLGVQQQSAMDNK